MKNPSPRSPSPIGARKLGDPARRPRYERMPMRIGQPLPQTAAARGLVATASLPVRALLKAGCAGMAAMIAAFHGTDARAQSYNGTGTVTTGSAGISTGGGTTNVTVGSPNVVIDWTPSDVGSAGTITFQNGGTTATFSNGRTLQGNYTVLNRILPVNAAGAQITNRAVEFFGTTQSFVNGAQGGNIWFYSPGGIIAGAGSVFNVGSLLMTTNSIDTTNGLVDANGTIHFTGAPNPAASVQMLSGSIVTAKSGLGQSYVAMVSPRIEQGGNINVDGSTAYVAAEAANITINNGLFDIAVTTGTTDTQGIVHNGVTTGPASDAAGYQAGTQKIYMVAIPKNVALTMLLSGTIGYTAAANATNEGSSVVLGAGYDVSGGLLNTNPNKNGSGSASIDVAGGNFPSPTTAHATNDVRIAPRLLGTIFSNLPPAPSVNFGQAAYFQGDKTATMLADGGGRINAQGDFTLKAGTGNVGGTASVTVGNTPYTTGAIASIFVGGQLSVDVSGYGADDTQPVTAGTATISATGAQIFANALFIDGTAYTSSTGNGIATTGGKAFVSTASGGTIISSGTTTIDVSADSGTESGSSGVGGNSTGGSISITGTGSLQWHDVYLYARANGDSGATQAGSATGGTVNVALTGGTNSWSNLYGYANASAGGGTAFASTLRGGKINITPSGTASLTLGYLSLSANAYGYSDSGNGGLVQAGDLVVRVGTGAKFTVNSGTYLNADAEANTNAYNQVGSGTFTSFAAHGGTISVGADGGQLSLMDLEASASARTSASAYSSAANAGDAFGGTITLYSQNGGTLATSCSSSTTCFLSADAQGGNGANGGNRGSGTGGTLLLYASDGTLGNANSDLTLSADGFGGATVQEGGLSGTGRGGTITVETRAGTRGTALIRLATLVAHANGGAFAGNESFSAAAGPGVAGFGGTVNLNLLGGQFTTGGAVTLNADGSGGQSIQGTGTTIYQGGNGTGGAVNILVNGGSANVGGLSAHADGYGAAGLSGYTYVADDANLTTTNYNPSRAGNGTGGTVNAQIFNGSLTATSLSLHADGFGGMGGAGQDLSATNGGIGTGGTAALTMNGGALSMGNTLDVAATGIGGDGGTVTLYNNTTGPGLLAGDGGAGFGGTATVALNGGNIFLVGESVSANGIGGDGGDNQGTDRAGSGGNGTGGSASFSLKDPNLVLNDLTVTALGNGGFGGAAKRTTYINSATTSVYTPGAGGKGGNGTGGSAFANFNGDPILSSLSIDASGTGGDGGDGATGGAGGIGIGGGDPVEGIGGAQLVVDGRSVEVGQYIEVTSTGTGGYGGIGHSGIGGAGGSGLGGYASVLVTNSGNLTTSGTFTLDASGLGSEGGAGGYNSGTSFAGAAGGSGFGGGALLTINNFATASLTGTSTVSADGIGADGLDGIGGATGGNGGAGGSATGGYANVLIQDGELLADPGDSGTSSSPFTISAKATGGMGGAGAAGLNRGQSAGTGGKGGDATGGSALFSNVGFAQFNSSQQQSLTIDATANGGIGGDSLGQGNGGAGGFGRGGTAQLVQGSSIQANGIRVLADGFGGQGGDVKHDQTVNSTTTTIYSPGQAGAGGDGTGGAAIARFSTTTNLQSLNLQASGTGGMGGTGGTGGAGGIGRASGLVDGQIDLGGGARLTLVEGTLNISDSLYVLATANGGQGGTGYYGAGGTGGDAFGGFVTIAATGDGSYLPLNSFIEMDSSGHGGSGGYSYDRSTTGFAGANGGNGTGGYSLLDINNEATAALSGLQIFADGTGGSGTDATSGSGAGLAGGRGGNGFGGTAIVSVTDDARASGQIYLISAEGNGGFGGRGGSGTTGGVGGQGGDGFGGTASLILTNGHYDGSISQILADGFGGEGGNGGSGSNYDYSGGIGGQGGVGTGGTASFVAENADYQLDALQLSAIGQGGDGGEGGFGAAFPGTPAVPGNPSATPPVPPIPAVPPRPSVQSADGYGGAGVGGHVVVSNTESYAQIEGVSAGGFAPNGLSAPASSYRTIQSLDLEADGRYGCSFNGYCSYNSTAGRAEINDNATSDGGNLFILDNLYVQVYGGTSTGLEGFYLSSTGGTIGVGNGASINTDGYAGFSFDGNGAFNIGTDLNLFAANGISVDHSNRPATLSSILADQMMFTSYGDINVNDGARVESVRGSAFTSYFGSISLADLIAGDSTSVHAGYDINIGNATIGGTPTFTSDPPTITGGVLELISGLDPNSGALTNAGNIRFTGTTRATGAIHAYSGGDITVAEGADVRSDNNIQFFSTDDIIVESGATLASAQNPIGHYGFADPTDEPSTLYLGAGSLLYNPNKTDSSAIRIDGTVEAPGSAIFLEGQAIQTTYGSFNSDRFYARATQAPASGGSSLTDDAGLDGDCAAYTICLGPISANYVEIGSADPTELPFIVRLKGDVSATDVQIRARDLFDGNQGSLSASNSLFVGVRDGSIDLGNANVSVTGRLGLYAGLGISGANATVSGGSVGIGTNGNISLFSLTSGSTIDTIDFAGNVTTAGTLVVPGIANFGTLITGGNLGLNAAGGITIGTLNSGGTTALTATNGAILVSGNLTSTGAVTATGRSIDITTGGATFSNAQATAGNLTLRSTGALIVTNGTATGTIAINAGTLNANALTAGGALALSGTNGLTGGTLRAGTTATLTAANGNILVSSLAATGNVIAVARDIDITGNGALTFSNARATAGNLALKSSNDFTIANGSATGNIAITARNLTATTLTAGGTLTGTLSGAGNIGTATSSGTFTLDAATTLSVTSATSSTGDVLLTARGGALTVGTASAGRDFSATANSGTFSINTLTAGRDIAVTALSTSFGSNGSVSAVRNLSINSANGIAAPSLSAGGTTTLTAANGNILVSSLNSAGAVTANARDIDLTLANSATIAQAIATAGNLKISGASGFTLTNGSATGDVTLLSSGGGITLGSVSTGRDLTITANSLSSSGTLTATRNLALTIVNGIAANALTAGGTTTLTSSAGNITVASLASGGAVTATARNIDITGNGALTFTSAQATAGNLALKSVSDLTIGTGSATGNITITARNLIATTLTAGGTLTATLTGNGTIGTGTSSGTFTIDAGGALAVTGATSSTGDVLLTARNGALTIANASAGRDFTASASGALGSTGTISAVRNASLTGGTTTLNALNAGGNIGIQAASLTATTLTAGGTLTGTLTGNGTVGTATSSGTLTLDAGGALGITNATSSASDVLLTARNGTLTIANATAGRDVTASSSGALNQTGTVTAARNASFTGATVNVAKAIATSGTLVLTGANGVTIGNGSAGTALTLASSGGNVTGANLTAQTIAVTAGGSSSLTGPVTATGALTVTAGGNASFAGTTVGGTISVTSTNIAIASGAKLGAQGTTSSLTLTSTDGTHTNYVGGADQQTGYSLSSDEISRLFATNITIKAASAITQTSLGGTAAPDLIIGAFTMTAGTNGNLGSSGTLAISVNGKARVTGAVALTGLTSSGTFSIDAGTALEIISGQGSIDLRDGSNNLSGTLKLSSADFIAATTQAITDVAAATTVDARDKRLALNDGVTSDDGIIRAGAIAITVTGGAYIQNTGLSNQFDARRGFSAGSLSITTKGQGNTTEIVINGRLLNPSTQGSAATFLTGLRVLPLISINGVLGSTATGFKTGSTINGCSIAAPASCGGDINPGGNTSTIRGQLDPAGTFQFRYASPIVSFRDFTPFGYPPLIDEPVTGSGNDDLWKDDCSDGSGQHAECPSPTGSPTTGQ